MTLTGFEPLQFSNEETALPQGDDSENDSLSTDPKLQSVLEALAAMTPEERAAIIAGILKTDVR